MHAGYAKRRKELLEAGVILDEMRILPSSAGVASSLIARRWLKKLGAAFAHLILAYAYEVRLSEKG